MALVTGVGARDLVSAVEDIRGRLTRRCRRLRLRIGEQYESAAGFPRAVLCLGIACSLVSSHHAGHFPRRYGRLFSFMILARRHFLRAALRAAC